MRREKKGRESRRRRKGKGQNKLIMGNRAEPWILLP